MVIAPETVYLESAQRAAAIGAELLRAKWQEPKRLKQKGFRDWVTETDFEVQELITNSIRERHPDHAFLAEEEASGLPERGEVIWIIDPIDGTTNFSRQQPNFSISIAAVSEAHALVGVILDPLRRELFSAVRNGPALLNAEAIHVSETPHLDNAVVALDWAHSPQARQATLDSLQRIGHEVRTLRAIGSAALGLAWVAAGRLDAYWNWYLNAWDLAAGAFIIEQAGGRCTTLKDDAPLGVTGGGSCLASNGLLHSELRVLVGATNPQ